MLSGPSTSSSPAAEAQPQRQRPGLRVEEPHLAVVRHRALVAGEAAHDVGAAPFVPHHAPSSLRARVTSPSPSWVRVERLRASRSSTGDPLDGVARADLGGAREIVDRPPRAVRAAHRGEHAVGRAERAQGAAARPEARRRGPAVDQAVRPGGVLGEVDRAGGGVDGRRPRASSGPSARIGTGSRLAAGVVRVDLEDVAVIALRAALALPGLGLLAAQPGAPRGDAAGAVRRRAGEADDLAQPGALARRPRRSCAPPATAGS